MLFFILFFLVSLILFGAWLLRAIIQTDPYSSASRVVSPYTTAINKYGKIILINKYKMELKNTFLHRLFGLLRAGIRIIFYSLTHAEKPLSGDEEKIINQIHQLRFNPKHPYVITGSHYSDLYMRNLGIFFNALLDPRLPTTEVDWTNRQRIALQTVAYDLDFLQSTGQAVTTIMPGFGGTFTSVNIYAPPSDALFAIVYTLKALTDSTFVSRVFPAQTRSRFALQTVDAALELLATYRQTLTIALDQYLSSILDQAGLVRQDITLSSARDGVKRQSSFYDNVIAWATVQLADELAISHQATLDKRSWKRVIMETFWDESVGIFKDDLSTKGETSSDQSLFSADSLIVTSTGFLDLKVAGDHQKLKRIVSYIRQNKLDHPFPLRYSRSNQINDMQPTVKFFAPSYMGDGIWSHWGMEYVKALLLLSPGQSDLAQLARQHLESYQQNIERFGGYPELYASDGQLFRSPLVHGVLHTGWVVNYEQARMMAGCQKKGQLISTHRVSKQTDLKALPAA